MVRKLQGTNAVHGAPLGEEDSALCKSSNMDGIMSLSPYQQKFILILKNTIKARGEEANKSNGMNYSHVIQIRIPRVS